MIFIGYYRLKTAYASSSVPGIEVAYYCPHYLRARMGQEVIKLNRSFTLKVEVYDNDTGAEGSATKHVEYEEDGDVRRAKYRSAAHRGKFGIRGGGNDKKSGVKWLKGRGLPLVRRS
jgi:hypothetical protein